MSLYIFQISLELLEQSNVENCILVPCNIRDFQYNQKKKNIRNAKYRYKRNVHIRLFEDS
jgi:hypothetical protein